jgi:hypothetical protein
LRAGPRDSLGRELYAPGWLLGRGGIAEFAFGTRLGSLRSSGCILLWP